MCSVELPMTLSDPNHRKSAQMQPRLNTYNIANVLKNEDTKVRH